MGMLSPNSTINPDMWDWNHVYLPYCSQDQWSGQNTTGSWANPAQNVVNWTVYDGALQGWYNVSQGYSFCGHEIFKAVIDYLKTNEGLSDASQVVMSGISSGGMGTYINSNYLGDQLPNTDVRVAPVAGFFNVVNMSNTFPVYSGEYQASGLLPFTPTALPGYISLWNSYLPPACVAANPTQTYVCFTAQGIAPTLTVPQFIIQSQTDPVQMEDNDFFCKPPSSLSGHSGSAQGVDGDDVWAGTNATICGMNWCLRGSSQYCGETSHRTLCNASNVWGAPFFCESSTAAVPCTADQTYSTNTQVRTWLQSISSCNTWMNNYYGNMTNEILGSLKTTPRNNVADGYFYSSCYIHAGYTLQAPVVGGYTFLTGLSAWMGGVDVRVNDTCGIMCNPTCPLYGS
jgi:hypothetical protein